MSDFEWYPHFYIAFRKKTKGMNLLERGAYLSMIDSYWTIGGPLPLDEIRIRRLIYAEQDEWEVVRECVLSFFVRTDEGWRSEELDEAIRLQGSGKGLRLPWKERRDRTREWRRIRELVFQRDNYTCTYCGVRGGNLECDHIIPYSAGGSDDEDNLTTACKPCNQRKGARSPEQWLANYG